MLMLSNSSMMLPALETPATTWTIPWAVSRLSTFALTMPRLRKSMKRWLLVALAELVATMPPMMQQVKMMPPTVQQATEMVC
jgi:hypothetical protein